MQTFSQVEGESPAPRYRNVVASPARLAIGFSLR